MKFSLILCTLNRDEEVKELLISLSNQVYKNFEVIIVDQNKDQRITNILVDFSFLDIHYLQFKKGLSRSRNFGLKHAKGEIVCFPDDDCIYPKNLLENINNFFLNSKYDILMGKTIDRITSKIVAGKNISKSQELFKSNILGSSTTLFIRNNNCNIIFDEDFGLGGKFNAEEENDLVFRLLNSGLKAYYNPDINYVYHPPSDLNYSDFERAEERAIGLGAFIAKHLNTIDGLKYFFKYNLGRPFLAIILYTFQCNCIKLKFYSYRWKGIWIGFYKYLRSNI